MWRMCEWAGGTANATQVLYFLSHSSSSSSLWTEATRGKPKSQGSSLLFPLMLYVADVTISQQEVTDFFYPIVSQFSFPIAISYPCKACAGGSVWGSPHKWDKHGALMRLWLWGRFSLLSRALHGSKHGSFIITLNRFIRFHLHFCCTYWLLTTAACLFIKWRMKSNFYISGWQISSEREKHVSDSN